MSGRQILELTDGAFVALDAITAVTRVPRRYRFNGEPMEVMDYHIFTGAGTEGEGFMFTVLDKDSDAAYAGLKIMMGEINQSLADKCYTVQDLTNRGHIRIEAIATREKAAGPEMENPGPSAELL